MKSPIFDKSCTEKSILQKIVDFKNQESYHSVIFLCKHAEKLRMKFQLKYQFLQNFQVLSSKNVIPHHFESKEMRNKTMEHIEK